MARRDRLPGSGMGRAAEAKLKFVGPPSALASSVNDERSMPGVPISAMAGSLEPTAAGSWMPSPKLFSRSAVMSVKESVEVDSLLSQNPAQKWPSAGMVNRETLIEEKSTTKSEALL